MGKNTRCFSETLVRVLGRYLNSKTEVKKLDDLCKRAASEHIERQYSPPLVAPARLTTEQNEHIAQLYKAGWKPVDIAREIGTTEWTVHHRLNRLGVERRPRGMTPFQCQEAVRYYAAGQSLRQIALRLGFNDKTIKKVIVEAGVKIRESPRHQRK